MEGCGWEGELSDKTVHLSKCKFMTALCDSCGLVVLRTDMDVHAKNCPQRKVRESIVTIITYYDMMII